MTIQAVPVAEADYSDLEVVLALTTPGFVSSHVAAGLAYVFGTLLGKGISTQVMVSDIVDVASARRKLTDAALQTTATHIMWLDGDILVDASGVLHLLAQRQRVIGGIYRKRTFPHEPVVMDYAPHFRGNGFTPKWNFDLNGLTQVGGMGQGCLLVELDVYREMSKHFGDDLWYVFEPDLGEDLWFFKRLAEMGIPAYLDGLVRCGHQTMHTVTVESEWAAGATVLEDERR